MKAQYIAELTVSEVCRVFGFSLQEIVKGPCDVSSSGIAKRMGRMRRILGSWPAAWRISISVAIG
jgi:hypothetical protein